MRMTRHLPHTQINFDYSLRQQKLEQVQSAKYLGVTFTNGLDWGQHVSEITSSATRTLGFLRRNLAFAPRQTKDVAYKTLIRPKLEYATPIWHPHVKTQIDQVEKVQRTAARWTCRREDGVTKAMLATCSMSLSGHLWRSAESSPLLSSFRRFTPVQCLLTKINI